LQGVGRSKGKGRKSWPGLGFSFPIKEERRQEAGGRSQKTGDRRQESENRRQEAGERI